MKRIDLKNNVHIKKSQSGIEFLVVFSILMVFFIIVADIALFFKEIYSTQAVADEALARLVSARQCGNAALVRPSLITAIENYHSGFRGLVRLNYTGNTTAGTYTSDDANRRFIFSVRCRNTNTPSSIVFTYRHYGLFMFLNGKYITSNVSTNTTFY